jgi:uncharacterized protein
MSAHPMGTPPDMDDPRSWLLALVHHLEHVLPAQAPIRDFVHHNTLHGYQHLAFPDALRAARALTGAEGYLSPERFRAVYAEGRINAEDLDAALNQAGVPDLDAVVVPGCSRRQLLTTVLRVPFKRLSRTQLRWQLAETTALRRWQVDVPSAMRMQLMAEAGAEAEAVADLWAACLSVLDLQEALRHPEELLDEAPSDLVDEADAALATHQMRREALDTLEQLLATLGNAQSLRSVLMQLTGEDLLDTLRPALIRSIAAHLDQGLAAWHSPARARGFYAAWRELAMRDPAWLLDDLDDEWTAVSERLPEDPVAALLQELRLLGIPDAAWADYLQRLALEIPGWSGMALQRSLAASVINAPINAPVAMLDFLAVRLVLERVYAQRICRRHWRVEASVHGLNAYFHHNPDEFLVRHALFAGKLPEYLGDFAERLVREAPYRESYRESHPGAWSRVAHLLWRWRQTPSVDRKGAVSVSGTAWPLFRLAQHLGLSGAAVRAVGAEGAARLLAGLSEWDADQSGYIWLQAYERHYREQIFAALAANHGRGPFASRQTRPDAQLVWCMDDREEGTRRHLEEINPRIETLGAAAHYSVFINWQGLGDRQVTTLCPVVARPAHAIGETAATGFATAATRYVQRRTQREDGRYRLLQGARLGVLTSAAWVAALAPLAALALAGKAFWPSRMGRFGEALRRRFEGEVPTRLRFTALPDAPAGTIEANRAGFSVAEQADRCQGFLRNIGLTDGFAPLVAIMGHGSNSLNNPHLSAYDCGACSGRHSGPNARLLVAMANHPEVRAVLSARGIVIPDDTWFLGAEHNTCDDSVSWYDTDLIPAPLQMAFAVLREQVDAAMRLHMQERCRRFASAPDAPSLKRAWRHIQDRRWDYSQPRPELGHATNACAIIGRRSVSRGVFFDRRAFLISYDPTRDADGRVLEGLLLANGPVGAGISLEYYFSTVDNERYGCGTKAVHNVTGYLGVMEGTSSDLRTGLPRQMIEIHEAMRLLVIVEQSLDLITAIYQRQPPLQELIGLGWLVVAAKDPETAALHLFDPAQGWIPWSGSTAPMNLPTVTRSREWFFGQRDPLPPALIRRAVEA